MNKYNKILGTVFILAGILLIFAAGVLTGLNAHDESVAEESSGEMRTQVEAYVAKLRADYASVEMPADYELDPTREMPDVSIDDVNIVGEVRVPRLGIRLPVASEWNVSTAKRCPCVYAGSAYTDDMIIAGHSYKSHFRGLYDIKSGDTVEFTDMDGNEFVYSVAEMETLDGYDVPGLFSGEWDLTLFTCTSNSRGRVTVRCNRVIEEALV